MITLSCYAEDNDANEGGTNNGVDEGQVDVPTLRNRVVAMNPSFVCATADTEVLTICSEVDGAGGRRTSLTTTSTSTYICHLYERNQYM